MLNQLIPQQSNRIFKEQMEKTIPELEKQHKLLLDEIKKVKNELANIAKTRESDLKKAFSGFTDFDENGVPTNYKRVRVLASLYWLG